MRPYRNVFPFGIIIATVNSAALLGGYDYDIGNLFPALSAAGAGRRRFAARGRAVRAATGD